MSDLVEIEELAPHQTLQYASAERQADTAVAGMWLFLASEVLFFGALFLAFFWVHHSHPAGYALAARHANLLIGAINTALLASSSMIFALGMVAHEHGRTDRLVLACAATAAIGLLFVALKGLEWSQDLDEHLWPGRGFALDGTDAQGARLFYCLYFIGTAVHAVHMLVGVVLVGRLGWRARRGWLRSAGPSSTTPWTTPVEVVGLYWSFVDMVWMVLFPLLYVLGRTA